MQVEVLLQLLVLCGQQAWVGEARLMWGIGHYSWYRKCPFFGNCYGWWSMQLYSNLQRKKRIDEHEVWNMPSRSMFIDNTCPTEARLVHHLVAWQQWGNLSLQKNSTELWLCWTTWIFSSLCSGLLFVDAYSFVTPLSSSSLNIWNNYP